MDVTELMEATKSGMNVVDMGVTVRKHKLIMKLLQAVKAFSGCNTVLPLSRNWQETIYQNP